jgi:hypothetical protein
VYDGTRERHAFDGGVKALALSGFTLDPASAGRPLTRDHTQGIDDELTGAPSV